jgi:hypothetical protein
MMKQKTHLVLWLAMLVAAVAIVLNPWPRAERTVLGIILLLGVVVGIVSFVKTFSGPITEEKLDSMFRFCYTVALLVVLLSVVFFFFPREKGNQQWPEFTGPVGIVLGCSEPPSFANDEKWIPDEISCDKDTTQWLLNFGGKVTTCDELTVTSELCEGTRVRGGRHGSAPLFSHRVADRGIDQSYSACSRISAANRAELSAAHQS